MPYDPVVNVPSPDCNNRTISWTAPDTDRDIKKYYIYRDGIFLANTTDNTTTNYTDRDKLDANTQHNYSVVAESCAGNSTNEIGTSFNVTGNNSYHYICLCIKCSNYCLNILYLVDLGKELNVTYDKNITVYVNWVSYMYYRGSRLIGCLGSRHSVPFIRFFRLTDVNYTIRYEFLSKTSSRLTKYPVYPVFPIKRLPLYILFHFTYLNLHILDPQLRHN